jgi:diguanylate cyclase (GGDEF)-like protein/PAS domain S-box-containing protein
MFNLVKPKCDTARRQRRIGVLFAWMLVPGLLSGCALLAVIYLVARPDLAILALPEAGALGLLAAGIVAGGVAASAVLAWMVLGYMLYPLRRLTDAVTRPAGAGQRVTPVCGPYEIALLAERFNRMLAERDRTGMQLRLAASVFEATSEGILIVSAGMRILEANGAFQRMSGYARDELVGSSPRMLQSGRHDAPFYAAMWQGLRTDGHWRGQIWDRRRDGSLFAALLTISAVPATGGMPGHYVALFADITELRRRQDEVERLAYLDPLTGLANRRVLRERLQAAISQAGAAGNVAAVGMVDLDEFKAVNDRRGHDAGDAVLVAVAGRLTQAVRAGDTVVRTGGDEFVIVLAGLVDDAEARDIMRRALAALDEPVALPGGSVLVGASIGLACYPRDGGDGETLLRRSDAAMYRAKELGRNRIVCAGGHES